MQPGFYMPASRQALATKPTLSVPATSLPHASKHQ